MGLECANGFRELIYLGPIIRYDAKALLYRRLPMCKAVGSKITCAFTSRIDLNLNRISWTMKKMNESIIHLNFLLNY